MMTPTGYALHRLMSSARRLAVILVLLSGWLCTDSPSLGQETRPSLEKGTPGPESTTATVHGRSAEQILEALDRIKIPLYDVSQKHDQAYVRAFQTRLKEATEKRDALILELYKTAPTHERVPVLMGERWSIRPYGLAEHKQLTEIDDVLARTRNPKLKTEALYARTYAKLYDNRRNKTLDLRGVEEYITHFPHDHRGAALLDLATKCTRDEKLVAALEDRIVKEFPDTLFAQKIQGIRHQAVRIGKPFGARVHRRPQRIGRLGQGRSRGRLSSSTSGPPGAGPASRRCPR